MIKKFLILWLRTFILFVGVVAYIGMILYFLDIGFYLLGILSFLAAISLLFTWLDWKFLKK